MSSTKHFELTLAVYYSEEVSYRRRKFKNEKSNFVYSNQPRFSSFPLTPPAHWHCTLLKRLADFLVIPVMTWNCREPSSNTIGSFRWYWRNAGIPLSVPQSHQLRLHGVFPELRSYCSYWAGCEDTSTVQLNLFQNRLPNIVYTMYSLETVGWRRLS